MHSFKFVSQSANAPRFRMSMASFSRSGMDAWRPRLFSFMWKSCGSMPVSSGFRNPKRRTPSCQTSSARRNRFAAKSRVPRSLSSRATFSFVRMSMVMGSRSFFRVSSTSVTATSRMTRGAFATAFPMAARSTPSP